MLFWALFDGILAFISPLIITDGGFSKTIMGFMIGSSSIFGALFDIAATRILPSHHYRRIFMIMFILCFIYPFLLYNANSIAIYLCAMAVWGIYYDLKNFGEFDIVSRYSEPKDHASSFGFVQALQSAGYLIAPIIAGIVSAISITWMPFSFSLLFLGISFIFFLALNSLSPTKTVVIARKPISKKHLLISLDRIIFPILLLTFVLYTIDAFFWTIGPLFAESISGSHEYAGILMAAYTLPALLVGWIVTRTTNMFGKKKTAYFSLLCGSILLMGTILVADSFIAILVLVFLASIFLSISMPSINGVYADLISERNQYEGEIESLTDFYTNIGYIIGPISAGYIADVWGNAAAFSSIGLMGVVVSLILFRITPKHITINNIL